MTTTSTEPLRLRRSRLRAPWWLHELLHRPSAMVGLAFIALLALLAVTGSLLAPHDPLMLDIPNRLQGPTREYPLGTDLLGRDLLSRIIAGTRTGFVIALPTVGLAAVIGLVVGVIGGYLGGLADGASLFVIDTVAAFPGLILALALVALIGPSIPVLIGALMIGLVPAYARVTRASVLALKEEGFVLAERSLGASFPRIAALHVTPNIIAPIIILIAMDIPVVIVAEAGLSFIGLGVPPPEPSWGSMLAEGFDDVRETPWPVLCASVAIALTMIAFTLVGEGLRSIFDPKGERLRGRRIT